MDSSVRIFLDNLIAAIDANTAAIKEQTAKLTKTAVQTENIADGVLAIARMMEEDKKNG